jgi:hypothetical protein
VRYRGRGTASRADERSTGAETRGARQRAGTGARRGETAGSPAVRPG